MQAVLVLFMRQFLAKELEALLFFSPINPQRAKALLSDTIWVAESANRVPSSEWSLGNEVFHTKVLHEPWGFSPFRGLLFSLWILWLIDPSFCPRNREISRVHRGRRWWNDAPERYIIHFPSAFLLAFQCKVLRPIFDQHIFFKKMGWNHLA